MAKATLFIGGDTCPNRPDMVYIDFVPTCIDSPFAFFLSEQFRIFVPLARAFFQSIS